MKEQDPVAQNTVSKQSRGVVEQHNVEKYAGDFAAQSCCEVPDSLSAIHVSHALIDEDGNIEVALFSGMTVCATTEEKRKPDRRKL